MKIRLTKVRESRRLTWWGWGLVMICIVILIRIWSVTIHGFLSQHHPIDASILIIEGYVSDSVLDSVLVLQRQTPCSLLVCAGLSVDKGVLCSGHTNHADYNAAFLRANGIDSPRIISAPSVATDTDRTYTTALAAKKKLKEYGYTSGNLNVVCGGTHARRSLLLYRKALKPDWNVGVITFSTRRYPGNAWWRTSEGARDVLYEMFGYFYCAIFFHP